MSPVSPKSIFNSPLWLVAVALLTGTICIRGLRTGQAVAPLKSMTHDIPRLTHPAWFWIIEAFWLALTALLACFGVRELFHRHSGIRGTAKKSQKADLTPAPPAAPTPTIPPAFTPNACSTSPGGRFVIRVYSQEMRMSHWVDTPELVDTFTDRILFAPQDSTWSMDSADWQSESRVAMVLRKYPGDHSPVRAVVDCAAGSATIGGIEVADLSDSDKIDHALEQAYKASKATYCPIRS